MGNEIITQNVQNYGNFNPPMNNIGMAMPMGMNAGLFGSAGQMGVADYSNDLFAPDFIKQPYNVNLYPQGQNTQIQNQQNQSIFSNPQIQNAQVPTQTFTGNETYEQPQQPEEEQIQKTHTGKTLGVLAGLSIPLVSGATKMFNGAKFSDVFKLKEMGLKGAAFALAGWCAGAIIDGIINSSKTNETQK